MSWLLAGAADAAIDEISDSLPQNVIKDKALEFANDEALSLAERIPVVGHYVKYGEQLGKSIKDKVSDVIHDGTSTISKHLKDAFTGDKASVQEGFTKTMNDLTPEERDAANNKVKKSLEDESYKHLHNKLRQDLQIGDNANLDSGGFFKPPRKGTARSGLLNILYDDDGNPNPEFFDKGRGLKVDIGDLFDGTPEGDKLTNKLKNVLTGERKGADVNRLVNKGPLSKTFDALGNEKKTLTTDRNILDRGSRFRTFTEKEQRMLRGVPGKSRNIMEMLLKEHDDFSADKLANKTPDELRDIFEVSKSLKKAELSEDNTLLNSGELSQEELDDIAELNELNVLKKPIKIPEKIPLEPPQPITPSTTTTTTKQPGAGVFETDEGPFETDEEPFETEADEASELEEERFKTPDDEPLTKERRAEVEAFLNNYVEDPENAGTLDIMMNELKDLRGQPIDPQKLETSISKLGDTKLNNFNKMLQQTNKSFQDIGDSFKDLVNGKVSKIPNSETFEGMGDEIKETFRKSPKFPIPEEADAAFNDFWGEDSAEELEFMSEEEAAEKIGLDKEDLESGLYDKMKNRMSEMVDEIIEETTAKDVLFGMVGGAAAVAGAVESGKLADQIGSMKRKVGRLMGEAGAPEELQDAVDGVLDDMKDITNNQTRAFMQTLSELLKDRNRLQTAQGEHQRALNIFNQPSTSIVTDNEHATALKKAERQLKSAEKTFGNRLAKLERQSRIVKNSITTEKRKRERAKLAASRRKEQANKKREMKTVAPRIQPMDKSQEELLRRRMLGESMKTRTIEKPINVNIINRVQSPSNNTARDINEGILNGKAPIKRNKPKMRDVAPFEFARNKKQAEQKKRITL